MHAALFFGQLMPGARGWYRSPVRSAIQRGDEAGRCLTIGMRLGPGYRSNTGVNLIDTAWLIRNDKSQIVLHPYLATDIAAPAKAKPGQTFARGSGMHNS